MSPAMPAPAAAKSLSTLTTLASNPPTYPRNPTQEVLEALVLYIVRVPGSQDVFLTTLKPREKTVTAEDVHSCLYYLHVSTDKDDTLMEERSHAKIQDEVERPDYVQRKPLPSNPQLELGDRPAPPPKVYPHYQPPAPGQGGDTQVKRKALRGAHLRFSSEEGREISRRPLLGPRPEHVRLGSVDAGTGTSSESKRDNYEPEGRSRRWTALPPQRPGTIEEARGYPDAGGWDGLGPPLLDHQNGLRVEERDTPRRGFVERGSNDRQNEDPTSRPPLPRRPHRKPTDPAPETFHITIIRRDLSSNNQWNIGTISNAAAVGTADPYTVDVDITTPGYRRFAKETALPSLSSLADLLPGRNNDPPAYSVAPNPPQPQPRSAPMSQSQTFRRSITLTQPQSPTKPFSRRQSISDSLPSSLSRPLRPLTTANANYQFLSPWNGTCTFSTGINGRSLKCRHVLPQALAGSDNGPSPAVPVCEIRFNLPSANSSSYSNSSISSLPNSTTPTVPSPPMSTSARTKAKLAQFKRAMEQSLADQATSSHSTNLQGNNYSSSGFSNNRDERMDLSLGREKAGGGWKGKSAKMGKLVVENEGLKFLDLVVAGAMGVFWVYYAGFGRTNANNAARSASGDRGREKMSAAAAKYNNRERGVSE